MAARRQCRAAYFLRRSSQTKTRKATAGQADNCDGPKAVEALNQRGLTCLYSRLCVGID
jgi:hypothetical protein